MCPSRASLRRFITAAALGLTLLGCDGIIGGAPGIGSGDLGETSDKEPGDLVVSSPARASFISVSDGATVVVEGHGATDALMVNGSPLTPDEDGSFSTTVTAATGLNLIEVVDGEHGLDVPFLYGSFAETTEMVPSALMLRVNALGFNDADLSKVSITQLAQRALDDIDILASIQGQSFNGDAGPADFTYTVEQATYGNASLVFAPLAGGASVGAAMQQLRVQGKLKIKLGPISKTDTVVLSADAISLNAGIVVSYQNAELHAAGGSVQADVDGFQYDSNNAGFPCCVDMIITELLRPEIEDQVQSAVQREAAKGMAFALEQFGLPSEIGINSDILSATIATQQQLDGAQFDAQGSTVSVAAGVQAATLEPGAPGEAAPGWLKMGSTPESMATATPFGISMSLDTLNQAIYAIWAQGSLEMDIDEIDQIEGLHVSLELPPVLLAGADDKVTIGVGEVVASGEFNGNAMQVAISYVDDVGLAIDPATHTFAISVSPEPTVSVTWLDASQLPEALRPLIKGVIEGQVSDLLASLELPLPSIPLDVVASSFGNSVALLGPDTTFGISDVSHRLSIYGSLLIVD